MQLQKNIENNYKEIKIKSTHDTIFLKMCVHLSSHFIYIENVCAIYWNIHVYVVLYGFFTYHFIHIFYITEALTFVGEM